ncbi:MAG: ATP-binding protein [Solirubrobacterales bacterium]|nr:ATP-binding protein [Solirubrobacterales bacterium]
MTFIRRNVEDELRDVLSVSRAGAILGPRQSGKSTLALRLQGAGVVPSYYTLDDEALRSAAQDDPDGFVAGLVRPAVIDEVQRAPGVLLAIKQVLDANPGVPGQFLLTGSANLLAAKQVADALPGRIEYVDLWPFSQGELTGRRETFLDGMLAGQVPSVTGAEKGRGAYAAAILAGGFPEARERSEHQRARFFDSYVRGVLGRDLPELAGARIDPARVATLLRLLAARTGGAVSFAGLGSELGIDEKTAKAYVEFLAQLFLVLQLPPWSTNLGARQVKTPKILLTDSGLAAALIGVDAARYTAVDQGEVAGKLLETFAVMELVKQRTWATARTQLFFYRDQRQREVDVVIESAAGDIAAVEVKSGATVREEDTRGLRFLRDKLGDRFKAGVVLCSGAQTVRLSARIWAVPLSGLWAE